MLKLEFFKTADELFPSLSESSGFPTYMSYLAAEHLTATVFPSLSESSGFPTTMMVKDCS